MAPRHPLKVLMMAYCILSTVGISAVMCFLALFGVKLTFEAGLICALVGLSSAPLHVVWWKDAVQWRGSEILVFMTCVVLGCASWSALVLLSFVGIIVFSNVFDVHLGSDGGK